MRDALLAFIKSVQDAVVSEKGFRHLIQIKQRSGDETLEFGYGYFDANKVMVWTGETERVVTPEEAVDILLPKEET